MGAAARTVLPLVTTGEASGGHRGPADDEGAPPRSGVTLPGRCARPPDLRSGACGRPGRERLFWWRPRRRGGCAPRAG